MEYGVTMVHLILRDYVAIYCSSDLDYGYKMTASYSVVEGYEIVKCYPDEPLNFTDFTDEILQRTKGLAVYCYIIPAARRAKTVYFLNLKTNMVWTHEQIITGQAQINWSDK
jgi:hypothetical protein